MPVVLQKYPTLICLVSSLKCHVSYSPIVCISYKLEVHVKAQWSILLLEYFISTTAYYTETHDVWLIHR